MMMSARSVRRHLPIILSGILICACAGPGDAQTNGVTEDAVDKRILRITARTGDTDTFERSAIYALHLLTPPVRQLFADHGVTVVITPTLEQLGLPPGHTEYDPRNKRVLICERNADGKKVDQRRIPITVLHELGHAFDHIHGHPSWHEEFVGIYSKELGNVPESDRRILAYFLEGNPHGARECFASLFACQFFPNPDRRLDALKASFPKSLSYVQSLR